MYPAPSKRKEKPRTPKYVRPKDNYCVDCEYCDEELGKCIHPKWMEKLHSVTKRPFYPHGINCGEVRKSDSPEGHCKLHESKKTVTNEIPKLLEITRIVRKETCNGEILSIDVNRQKFLPATPEREKAGEIKNLLRKAKYAITKNDALLLGDINNLLATIKAEEEARKEEK